ncbi:uncharacterized protein METZ01_LOCUS509707, partial [marine metagenome]
ILSVTGEMNLSIYNISGQLIETLVSGKKNAGNYSMMWDASMQPSGMYLLRLQTVDEVHHQKLLLIK